MHKRWGRITRPLVATFACLWLSACTQHKGFEMPADPLVFEPRAVARADHIAIFVTGVFASVDIFDGAKDWENHGITPVYYRFPGYDGLPVAPPLNIAEAGRHIARFANQYPDAQISLVGYSTGAAISAMAAPQITSRHPVSAALISPAPEYGGGAATLARGTQDFLWAATRANSVLTRDVWPVYWRSLLFGAAALDDTQYTTRIEDIFARHGPSGPPPSLALIDAHTGDLQRWSLPADHSLAGVRTAMFIGENDRVFTPDQQAANARRLGVTDIRQYPQDGHLLTLSRDGLFDDIFRFLTAP